MIYYFVKWDGYLSSEDNTAKWYGSSEDIFTNRKQAIAVARWRTKVRIAKLKEYYKEVKCYRHTE